MILYHVTRKKHLNKILENGIKFGDSPFHLERQKYIYLTDKKGIKAVVMGWIYCENNPIVLEVNIPKQWLKTTTARVEDYVWDNPRAFAREWMAIKPIPPEYITAIYEYEC